MIEKDLNTLKIHKLSQAQYDREVAAGNIDEDAIYLTPDNSSSNGGSNVFYVDVTETFDGTTLNTEWDGIIDAYDNNSVLICRYFKIIGGVSYNVLTDMYRYGDNGTGRFVFSGITSDGDILVIGIDRTQIDIPASVSYTKIENLNEQLGDVSTALDRIIELQEELIGV